MTGTNGKTVASWRDSVLVMVTRIRTPLTEEARMVHILPT